MGLNFSPLRLLLISVLVYLANAQTYNSSIYHTYINTYNLSLSTQFYTDGIGLSVLSTFNATGDYKYLFGAETNEIQEKFLGDPNIGDANGVLDLVYFPGLKKGPPQPNIPVEGYFVISFHVDINSTLARLSSLGFGGVPRIITEKENNITLAVVRDPDGLQVLLLQATT